MKAAMSQPTPFETEPASPTAFEREVYAMRSLGQDAGEVAAALARAKPWYEAFLAEWLPENRDSVILDVPCGHGNLLYCLTELGYRAVRGVDADEGQVRMAQSLRLPAEVGDAFDELESIPLGSVSRIFSVDFLEHVPKSKALEFCRLSFRALEPGGWLVCRTPAADGPFGAADRYNDVTHEWGMTSSAAFAFFKLAGFSVITVRDEAPVPYKWVNRVRRVMYTITTKALSASLNLVGIGAPAIWTRSMWIAARKP